MINLIFCGLFSKVTVPFLTCFIVNSSYNVFNIFFKHLFSMVVLDHSFGEYAGIINYGPVTTLGISDEKWTKLTEISNYVDVHVGVFVNPSAYNLHKKMYATACVLRRKCWRAKWGKEDNISTDHLQFWNFRIAKPTSQKWHLSEKCHVTMERGILKKEGWAQYQNDLNLTGSEWLRKDSRAVSRFYYFLRFSKTL